MLRYNSFILFFFITIISLQGQDVGATFYSGISAGKTKDQLITQNDQLHYGYNIGIDARINSGAMYFLMSAEYGKLDYRGLEENTLLKGEKVNIFKGRGGLGFKILGISEKIYFASRLQASFNLVSGYDAENIWLQSNKINDSFMGLNTGLEFHFYSLWTMIGYEKGLVNMYFQRPDSVLDLLSLAIGVKF